MAVLSKLRRPDKFQSSISLKRNFTNSRSLCSNFVGCHSFFERTSPDILALCGRNLVDSIDHSNFFSRSYIPLIRQDSVTKINGLAVYMKKGIPFAQGLSLGNTQDLIQFHLEKQSSLN